MWDKLPKGTIVLRSLRWDIQRIWPALKKTTGRQWTSKRCYARLGHAHRKEAEHTVHDPVCSQHEDRKYMRLLFPYFSMLLWVFFHFTGVGVWRVAWRYFWDLIWLSLWSFTGDMYQETKATESTGYHLYSHLKRQKFSSKQSVFWSCTNAISVCVLANTNPFILCLINGYMQWNKKTLYVKLQHLSFSTSSPRFPFSVHL